MGIIIFIVGFVIGIILNILFFPYDFENKKIIWKNIVYFFITLLIICMIGLIYIYIIVN